MKKAFPPIVFFFLLLLIWEVSVDLSLIPSYLTSSPRDIVRSLVTDRAIYTKALRETVIGALGGFMLSVVVGFCAGVLFSFSNIIRRAIYPFAVFFQTVPIIAIAPLLVVWFGYGVPSVIASAFIVSIFPMVASTLSGLDAAPLELRNLFRIYHASRLQLLLKLLLPCALPHIMSGLRIVAGLAVIGTIVGELMGGVGIGSVIDVARMQQRMDQVFAAIFLASLLGFFLVRLIDVAALFLKRFHVHHPIET